MLLPEVPEVQISLLLFIFSPSLTLDFPNTPPQSNCVSCRSFSCNALLSYQSPIGIVVTCGEGEKFYCLLIMAWCVSGPLSLESSEVFL